MSSGKEFGNLVHWVVGLNVFLSCGGASQVMSQQVILPPPALALEPLPASITQIPDNPPLGIPATGIPVQAGSPVGMAVVGPVLGLEAPQELSAPLLPPEVQVVRIQGPDGVAVSVIGPDPEPVSIGDGRGLATFGMRVGTSYYLRLSNLPNRPDAEIYPVVQLVGHLHRPTGIDPSRYPIRIQFTEDDIENVLRNGRLVTEIVYLEDPEQALPLHLPKDEIPVVTLSPAEDAMRVAKALGRPMAIVQIGNRAPTADDLDGSAIFPIAPVPCPFMASGGEACSVACGPCEGTPPPPGRSWLPRDEFLCDGGDQKAIAATGGNGNLRGIDPRDAVIRFQAERNPRVLPTNMVCIYAPRFGAVRRPYGTNAVLHVDILAANELLQNQQQQAARQGPKRMALNQTPEAYRIRNRASELADKIRPGTYDELRVLAGIDTMERVHGNVRVQGPEVEIEKVKAVGILTPSRLVGIKTAESAIVQGIVTGPNEKVMSWKPQETVGVEEPPNKPGLAVLKQVDVTEAEPGDYVNYTIRFRNMGNVPIRAVSIVDSLLPRLEYVPQSAQGPKGTVFTSEPNEAGSTELRWDLPGALKPGDEGAVKFKAKIR